MPDPAVGSGIPAAACRSGEASYLLAEQEGDIQSPDEEKGPDKEMRELKEKVKALAERVAELERSEHGGAGGSKPVTGDGGGGMLVLSEAGQVMMEAGSTAEGRGVVRVGPQFTCTGTMSRLTR